VIDVSGKWDALSIEGPGAIRLLCCALDLEGVLKDRDCAAVTLFDCPAVLARVPDGFALWVQSSYTADFVGTAERLRLSLEEAL
jgi:sarcosine oxidase gamma subunit